MTPKVASPSCEHEKRRNLNVTAGQITMSCAKTEVRLFFQDSAVLCTSAEYFGLDVDGGPFASITTDTWRSACANTSHGTLRGKNKRGAETNAGGAACDTSHAFMRRAVDWRVPLTRNQWRKRLYLPTTRYSVTRLPSSILGFRGCKSAAFRRRSALSDVRLSAGNSHQLCSENNCHSAGHPDCEEDEGGFLRREVMQ